MNSIHRYRTSIALSTTPRPRRCLTCSAGGGSDERWKQPQENMSSFFRSPREWIGGLVKRYFPPFSPSTRSVDETGFMSDEEHNDDDIASYWVVRKCNTWPRPEEYATVMLPHPTFGYPERYIAAFCERRHAESFAASFKCSSSSSEQQRRGHNSNQNGHTVPTEVKITRVAVSYLKLGTYVGSPFALFDDDVTYLEPITIFCTAISIMEEIEPERGGVRSEVLRMMEHCFQMPPSSNGATSVTSTSSSHDDGKDPDLGNDT